jgi:phospholipid-transporting ATPase
LWNKDYQRALTETKDREEKVSAVAELIEKGFTLIGTTAIEDKLQDDVPEVIRDLIEVNVKVWMLTGDKLETAENIAFSCRLIQPDF